MELVVYDKVVHGKILLVDVLPCNCHPCGNIYSEREIEIKEPENLFSL